MSQVGEVDMSVFSHLQGFVLLSPIFKCFQTQALNYNLTTMCAERNSYGYCIILQIHPRELFSDLNHLQLELFEGGVAKVYIPHAVSM